MNMVGVTYIILLSTLSKNLDFVKSVLSKKILVRETRASERNVSHEQLPRGSLKSKPPGWCHKKSKPSLCRTTHHISVNMATTHPPADNKIHPFAAILGQDDLKFSSSPLELSAGSLLALSPFPFSTRLGAGMN